MQIPISKFDAISQQTIQIREPVLADGARMWRIAEDSRVLDTNSSYAYLLWCRDFADTSIIAEIDGEVAGFVIGYTRPAWPRILFIWQVAVDHPHRGHGLGVDMLDALMESCALRGVAQLETTIAPDNPASVAMFASLARRRGAALTRTTLFTADQFPGGHQPEDLYRIAPVTTQEEWR
ncbi:diaminobutyrate acetyltransferase [Nocardia aurantiaca]|uniref:L-2,4-diaminobutyric acid acetyltransferase n=1 Tax=Nocardia aurantiaca TaxID=2675850 RepID=A0A6I3LBJ6_9NOCA|nr:diaminobutyrate acetyltransferase [Nocardia aurantiaca]MTE17259.1 diaminobutyrate acetyltransferase [Nocardia aurantiaca]